MRQTTILFPTFELACPRSIGVDGMCGIQYRLYASKESWDYFPLMDDHYVFQTFEDQNLIYFFTLDKSFLSLRDRAVDSSHSPYLEEIISISHVLSKDIFALSESSALAIPSTSLSKDIYIYISPLLLDWNLNHGTKSVRFRPSSLTPIL